MSPGLVFLVDDNPGNLNLLAGILRQAGYEVRMANTARRALMAVRAAPPELIMLDITMPEMDGHELCAQLKADPALCDIPVIFISALDDVQDKVRAFKGGGMDYVSKPFQAEEVLARVECQLRLTKLRRDLERKNEELRSKNEELLRSWRRTELCFSALAEVLPGAILDDKYRIEDRIGSGGFGAVYRATHLGLMRQVAVKVLRPGGTERDASGIHRFRQEGISACRVQHGNAVSVLDFGVCSAGIPYLVMELLDGWSLRSELKGGTALPLSRCVEIALPVCEVLAAAHAAGIVHRDIKPDNIFIHHEAGEEIIKVVDFGIAKLVTDGDSGKDADELTRSGQVLGTPSYVSPERLLDQPYDGRADVYSIGVLLYLMLCGRLPFAGGSPGAAMAALMSLTRDPVPVSSLNPEVPLWMERLVMQALSRDPEKRPSAAWMASELHGAGLVPSTAVVSPGRGAGPPAHGASEKDGEITYRRALAPTAAGTHVSAS